MEFIDTTQAMLDIGSEHIRKVVRLDESLSFEHSLMMLLVAELRRINQTLGDINETFGSVYDVLDGIKLDLSSIRWEYCGE